MLGIVLLNSPRLKYDIKIGVFNEGVMPGGQLTDALSQSWQTFNCSP